MPPIKSLLQREGRGIFDDKGKLGDRKKGKKSDLHVAPSEPRFLIDPRTGMVNKPEPVIKPPKPDPRVEKAKREAAKPPVAKVLLKGKELAKASKPVPPKAGPIPLELVSEWGAILQQEKAPVLNKTVQRIEEAALDRPDALVPLIDLFVDLMSRQNKKVVQACVAALPAMARLQPARVAKHLPLMTERFSMTTEAGKDGFVSTFAALCTASVAYQKRLEPVLELALSTADPKTLERWTNLVLPSLKGEPHARARAVVESRLYNIPRATAQSIASFLGIKLRPQA